MACAPACLPDPGCLAFKELNLRDQRHKKSSSISSEFKEIARKTHPSMLHPPALSIRGQHHRDTVTPFWSVFDQMLGNAYCHKTNTNGVINMGIANNFLMESELLDFFHKNLKLVPTDLTYGTSLFGSLRLFDALCLHYNSAAFSPVTKVLSEHIMTGPGCGPLLDQIFEHLADPGDSVLIAAPYYNGFDADLACRSAVKCIPVYSDCDDGTGASNFEGKKALRGFEKALEENNEKIKAVIVCNPNNPIGRCYDRNALLEYGHFAEKHNLHLVFDEIYALSTFVVEEEEDQPRQKFISALNIDWAIEAGCHPGRIHILSSASKDFGMNGFRIGTLVSQANEDLMRAMKATAKLYMVSAAADALFSALLSDVPFYQSFIATNQARMAQAYSIVARWCRHHQIGYTPSNAGHFLLVDLERFMPRETEEKILSAKEREGTLWSTALENLVSITPGSNYYHPHNGTFRLTFTLGRPALLEGLRRLEKTLGLEHMDMTTFKVEEQIQLQTITSPNILFVAKEDAPNSAAEVSIAKSASALSSKVVAVTELPKVQVCS